MAQTLLCWPVNCCTGDVYVADTSNHCIRLVSASAVSTVAGSCGVAGWTPDGPAASSMLSSPYHITMGPGGSAVYWTEAGTCVVRRLHIAAAQVSTVAGTPRGCGAVADGSALTARFGAGGPQGLGFFGNDLYISDSSNNVIRLLASATGAVTTYAGQAGSSGASNGPFASALFNVPSGIAVDPSGGVYVADASNSAIRYLAAGSVTTVAGTPGTDGMVDGLALGAEFDAPSVRVSGT